MFWFFVFLCYNERIHVVWFLFVEVQCVCVAATKSAEKLTPELVLALFFVCIQRCSCFTMCFFILSFTCIYRKELNYQFHVCNCRQDHRAKRQGCSLVLKKSVLLAVKQHILWKRLGFFLFCKFELIFTISNMMLCKWLGLLFTTTMYCYTFLLI